MPAGANYDSGKALPSGTNHTTKKGYCRPDIVITEPGVGAPAEAADMKKIYDLKLQCEEHKDLKGKADWDPDKALGTKQRVTYEKIKTFKKDGEGGRQKKGGVEVQAIGPAKESCP